MTNKKICCNCNTVNNINSKFCIECGSNNFKLPKPKLRYCYSCLIGFSEEACPICGEENYTNDLIELIKYKNKFNSNNLINYQNLVDENKELNEVVNNKKEELTDLLEQLDVIANKYNKLKKKYDENHKDKILELNKLEALLSLKKRGYEALDNEMNELVRKIGVQSISINAKDAKLSSLKKEYEEMLDTKNKLTSEKNSLVLELEKTINEYNLIYKNVSNAVVEFELALYGSLGEKYFNKDKSKSYFYYEKVLSLKNNAAITNFVMLVNDEYESYYDKQKAIYWTNYAYDYFNKKRNYTIRESVAIATIFSNPNTIYFNKEKALRFIPKGTYYLDEKYYIARCYERLGMKEEALKLYLEEYNSMKFGRYSDSSINKFHLKQFETAINRIKNMK